MGIEFSLGVYCHVTAWRLHCQICCADSWRWRFSGHWTDSGCLGNAIRLALWRLLDGLAVLSLMMAAHKLEPLLLRDWTVLVYRSKLVEVFPKFIVLLRLSPPRNVDFGLQTVQAISLFLHLLNESAEADVLQLILLLNRKFFVVEQRPAWHLVAWRCSQFAVRDCFQPRCWFCAVHVLIDQSCNRPTFDRRVS